MSTVSTWRQRRRAVRTRRALERAAFGSASPTMRDELLTIANRR
ncbi:hypothetical protein [Blastococcus sp. SYSU D00695]